MPTLASRKRGQRGLAVEERKTTQILAIMLDQVECIADCDPQEAVVVVRAVQPEVPPVPAGPLELPVAAGPREAVSAVAVHRDRKGPAAVPALAPARQVAALVIEANVSGTEIKRMSQTVRIWQHSRLPQEQKSLCAACSRPKRMGNPVFWAVGVLSATPLMHSLCRSEATSCVSCLAKPEDAMGFAERLEEAIAHETAVTLKASRATRRPAP
jgi:hypothetical protein